MPARLTSVAPELDAMLAAGDRTRCKRAALAAAQQAAVASGLTQIASVEPTEINLAKLDALIRALDAEYFSLQQQSGRGASAKPDCLVPFARARAASAMAFALRGETREAVYEAIVATDDAAGVTQTVKRVLRQDA